MFGILGWLNPHDVPNNSQTGIAKTLQAIFVVYTDNRVVAQE